MAFSRKHHLVMVTPDDPAYENKPSNWNEPHDVEDAVSGGIPYFSSTTTEGTSALLAAGGIVVGGGVGTAPLTYTNLTYSETSGPRLKVGTSGTSAGWLLGYAGSSGQAAIWNAAVTPTSANYAMLATNDTVILNGGGYIEFKPGNVSKGTLFFDAGRGLYLTAGTATTDVNALSATQTWNAAGVAFTFADWTITDTASAAGALAFRIRGGAAGTTNLFSVDKSGGLSAAAIDFSTGVTPTKGWYSTGTNIKARISGFDAATFDASTLTLAINLWTQGAFQLGSAADNVLQRAATNSTQFSGGTAIGGATARTEINKAVTAFTDGVAKTVFTLTIPNAAHSASYLVRLTGSIGAGGAIGANEASATNCYVVTLTRTAGVNATAAISAAFGASATAVAGATTVTCTAALAAVSGAVGASNTIDIQATITKAGGASDNHTCVATASLLNANASGITIS